MNYKLLFVQSVLFCFITLEAFSQTKTEFEGIIKFTTSYIPNQENISADDLINFFGDTTIAYIKKGNYIQEYPTSNGVIKVIYDNESNIYYSLMKGIDTLYFSKAKKTDFKYKLKKVKDDSLEILGYKCSRVDVISPYNKSKYYYTTDLFLSSKYFKKHKIGGYNLLTNYTNSIYLAMVGIKRDYKYTMRAYKIEEKKLDDSLFELPDYPKKEL